MVGIQGPFIIGSPRLAASIVEAGPQLPEATAAPPAVGPPVLPALDPVVPAVVAPVPAVAVPFAPPLPLFGADDPLVAGCVDPVPAVAVELDPAFGVVDGGVIVLPLVPEVVVPTDPALAALPALPGVPTGFIVLPLLLLQPNTDAPATIQVADAQSTYRCFMVSSADPWVWASNVAWGCTQGRTR
jgi:hypothetical protein